MSYLRRIKTDPIVVIAVVFITIVTFFSHKENSPQPTVKKTPSTVSKKDPGNLIFHNNFHDFGKVTEGDIVKHTFKFTNKGPGIVKIIKTKTTCGCTTANAALKGYVSGETGELEVTIDTRGKKGIVVKPITVYLENSLEKTVELNLTMHLKRAPHPDKENVFNINKDPQCKTCHLDRAVGQKGIFLYHRICSQCHGKKGRGASAMAFKNKEWQKVVTDKYLRTIIKDGLLEKMMPPYVTGVDPALTVEQVDSLVEYIRTLGK